MDNDDDRVRDLQLLGSTNSKFSIGRIFAILRLKAAEPEGSTPPLDTILS
jgi:hypothetical protein